MNDPTRILIVEDSSTDADLASREIRKALTACVFEYVETREAFLAALEAFRPDLIVSDYTMPRFDGMTALKLALERAPLTPVIIWTGSLNEDTAVKCMKAGATNYVLKDNIKRLGPAVAHALEEGQTWMERKRAEEAVRQAEENFRGIFENAVEGIFQSSPQGRFTKVNPAMAHILGYASPDEVITRIMSIQDQFYAEPASRTNAIKQLEQEGTLEKFESECLRKDGSRIWISENARAVTDANGSLLYYEGFIQDITERKHAEVESQRRAEQFAALNDAALKIQRHLDAGDIYRNACDELRRFGALASVFNIDTQGQLRHVYTSMTNALSIAYVVRFGDRAINFAIPVSIFASAGLQIFTQTSVLNLETLRNLVEETSPEIRQLADWMYEQVGPSPLLLAPLTQDGRTTDLLAVVGKSLDEADVPAVTLFARHVSIALETARLFAAEQARRAELAALYDFSSALVDVDALDAVFKLIVRSAAKTIRATFARIGWLEDDQLVIRATYPLRVLRRAVGVSSKEETNGLEWYRRVLAQTAPVVVYADDPSLDSQAREMLFLGIAASVCLVPLHANNVPIGLLIVAEERNPGREPFSAEKQNLARAIGDQAASAIRRAALHEDTTRRVEQLEALKSIDRTITASFDLPITLNFLLEQLATQLHVDAAAVLLLEPHQQTLDYAAGRGFRTREAQNAHIRVGEDFAGRAALERQIVRVDDFAKTQASPHLAALWAGEGFASYYGVPLIVKGQVKGVLEVYQRALFHPNSDWIGLMEMLAGQAALAIDNAELFQNLERSNTDLILAYDSTIEGWSRALDLRDKETEGHTQRVIEITLRLARAMGIGDAELVHIRRGALLHDIGKMGVPDRILLKPGGLDEDEWAIMRKHPVLAYELLSPIAYFHPALDIPYCHHEKWDGTGYPRGLREEQIPLAARLFAVVDVWDALRSDRPYRPAWTAAQARENIVENIGKHFDPELVKAFLKLVDSGI